MFLETSALTGEGVAEVFLKCARTILTKIEMSESMCIHPPSIYTDIEHPSATHAHAHVIDT